MDFVLIVAHEFGGYRRGEVIDDPKKMQEILDGPHQLHVRKVPKPKPVTK